jgi:gamma-glutamyltranspeptidase/glutathione hydrolase
MLNTPRSLRGMVTAPHHLASEAGLRVLREGGNAIEAMIAMAATVAVVYPHMNGIGGDGFWLVALPGQDPIALDGCGAAAAKADVGLYARAGHGTVPIRGPLAANTVAGTISAWGEALRLSTELGGTLPLARLVEDAVWHAENGFAVTASQAELTRTKLPEFDNVPGFAETFLANGNVPRPGDLMRFPALGATLRRLGEAGTQDFYTGQIARALAADLERLGSPVSAEDLARHTSSRRAPLSVSIPGCRLFNFPPPTQGISSLMILAVFARLSVTRPESVEYVHGLVEATKQAFLAREALADPDAAEVQLAHALSPENLDRLAARIDKTRALPWPAPAEKGDTVWMGAVDRSGIAVSFIQSVYFEFGSGCVLPETGVTWQNRGASFQLEGQGPRALKPGRKPFHTLNPAMARFDDGRVMTYGTMGGEGQPQTQAALFSRYAMFGQDLQSAITAPRWLLGRTWGEDSVTLKLESRFEDDVIGGLKNAGHDVEMLGAFTGTMGHAGAIVRHAHGLLEGATDPRSDGAVYGF